MGRLAQLTNNQRAGRANLRLSSIAARPAVAAQWIEALPRTSSTTSSSTPQEAEGAAHTAL
jgi:hypothetical protein